MKSAIVIAVLGTVLAGPAAAQYRGPLTMVCHPLLRGVPMDAPTKYEALGRSLYSQSEVGRTLLSSEGVQVPLGRFVQRGVTTRTFASHTRDSSLIIRRVYWQTGTGPRRLRFSERYDFQRQRITSTGTTGDNCNARAR